MDLKIHIINLKITKSYFNKIQTTSVLAKEGKNCSHTKSGFLFTSFFDRLPKKLQLKLKKKKSAASLRNSRLLDFISFIFKSARGRNHTERKETNSKDGDRESVAVCVFKNKSPPIENPPENPDYMWN